MLNKKEMEMRIDAVNDIIETLEWYSGYYCDLHNDVFNTDYYIIGTYEAEKALEEYGVFDAIEKVMDYEKMNFGEIYTEIHDPEKLVNMLYYIIGEEVLYEMESISEHWDEVATEEVNHKIIDELKSTLPEVA